MIKQPSFKVKYTSFVADILTVRMCVIYLIINDFLFISSRTRTIYNIYVFADGDGPFRLFPKEECKVFPLTNGSLFPSLLTLPVDAAASPYTHYKKGKILATVKLQFYLRFADTYVL